MNAIYEYLCDAVMISVSAALVSVLSSVIGGASKKYIELLVGISVICALVGPFTSLIKSADEISLSFSTLEQKYEYEDYEGVILRRAESVAAERASELVCEKFMMDSGDIRVAVNAELVGDEVKIVSAYFECDTIKRRAIKEYLSEILGCEVEYG